MKNSDPFKILTPNQRWMPASDKTAELLPPLVGKIRIAVEKWRDDGYSGVSDTSASLMKFWFEREHFIGQNRFRFFFSQREAIESIIYLYEVAKAKDKYDLMRFDPSEQVSAQMFDETWTRYVVKMATGTGKTKVIGLALVWSYFNKFYATDCGLSKNFLIVAPNIIVLNRLRKDFDGFKMFFQEPFIPENGFDNKDWKNDFQLTLHIQDALKPIAESGNIFLTNIHRVFFNEEPEETLETLFLGAKPKPDADTSKGLDLGKVLRSDKIKDLVIFNDEAHHIHDKKLAWFKAIADISNKLKLKTGKSIGLQADFSATPKHNKGAIFVQTISDYPLVEAIQQKVVKSPVLPDEASRKEIIEKDSVDFIERYQDYIRLGYLEWEKQYKEFKNCKTPILFIMTTNTKEADQAAEFLEQQYPLMKNAVLTIHTNKSGEIKETAKGKRDKQELEKLRKAADELDKDNSLYKAVVSVLMLREGWDVKNVTTVVGLRPFQAKSKILPEQTIGRGLRKMFSLEAPEKLVVIGTTPFLEFVEELKTEGVEFEYRPINFTQRSKNPIIIEVDKNNRNKNLDELDILIPQLSPRIYRKYRSLETIDINKFTNKKADFKIFEKRQIKEITFSHITGEFSHKTVFTTETSNYRNVISFFTSAILKQSRLISGFDILYPKVKNFIQYRLFTKEVELNNPQTVRNLSEAETKNIIFTIFKTAIDNLTITDKGFAEIVNYRSLKNTKPQIVENLPYIIPVKSVFNKIVCDNKFELNFASALDRFDDIICYAKNTIGEGGINFKIEYQAQDKNIKQYYPDFFVKQNHNSFFIIETKGREEINDICKIKRLAEWCKDVNNAQTEYTYTPLYIKQEKWEALQKDIKSFSDIIKIFSGPYFISDKL